MQRHPSRYCRGGGGCCVGGGGGLGGVGTAAPMRGSTHRSTPRGAQPLDTAGFHQTSDLALEQRCRVLSGRAARRARFGSSDDSACRKQPCRLTQTSTPGSAAARNHGDTNGTGGRAGGGILASIPAADDRHALCGKDPRRISSFRIVGFAFRDRLRLPRTSLRIDSSKGLQHERRGEGLTKMNPAGDRVI